jgi:hypothetical protein
MALLLVERNRNEMLSHAGLDALTQHYLIVSKKCLSVGQPALGSKFESMALQNLSILSRYKYRFKSMILRTSFCKRILGSSFLVAKFILHPEKKL